MRGNLKVAAATVVLFIAGLVVGIWTERTRPLPPPPIGPMGEFAHVQAPNAPIRIVPVPRRPPSKEMRIKMAHVMRQIGDFERQVAYIEQTFRNAFEAVLRTDQKQKLDSMKRHLETLPDPLPGCAPEMGPIFVSMVIFRPLYDHLSAELSLDEKQKQRLNDLLLERRKQLLVLVDETPPPSFQLPELIRPDGSAPPPNR